MSFDGGYGKASVSTMQQVLYCCTQVSFYPPILILDTFCCVHSLISSWIRHVIHYFILYCTGLKKDSTLLDSTQLLHANNDIDEEVDIELEPEQLWNDLIWRICNTVQFIDEYVNECISEGKDDLFKRFLQVENTGEAIVNSGKSKYPILGSSSTS